MSANKVTESSLLPDPKNNKYTIPRSYGVYELPSFSKGKANRFGNHPVRRIELEREFGSVIVIELYLKRDDAKNRADYLNAT